MQGDSDGEVVSKISLTHQAPNKGAREIEDFNVGWLALRDYYDPTFEGHLGAGQTRSRRSEDSSSSVD